MKTIRVSDEDYKTLMELSKELQTQQNHHQAFPYFWEAASEKLVPNVNDEGEIVTYVKDGERISLEYYAEEHPKLYEEFLDEEDIAFESGNVDYREDLKEKWGEFIKEWDMDVCRYTEDWEQSTDHNPSLFLSDVQDYIKYNSHHLGRKPRTYANTIWRMAKMESLVACIYKLNKQPKDKVNNEAQSIVFKKEKGK